MPRPVRNRTSRRVRWLAALAALSLGVTTLAATQPAEAKPDRRGSAPVSRYVALGDSYAAGEGLAPYEDGTDNPPANACHRSRTQSYPELLETSSFSPFQNLTSVACSGAGTAALFADVPDRGDEPAQLAAVTPDTTTVTLSIGGNDAGFAQVLAGCIYSPSPDVQSSVDGQAGCKKLYDPLVSRQIAALSGRPGAPDVDGTVPIPDIIKAIHAQAPNATILVSGYPKLFGTKTTNKYGCQVGLLPIYIKGSDARWIRHKASDLNDAIRYGVRKTRHHGIDVHYVNVAKKFVGHNVCDRRRPWINSVVFGPGPSISPASFHPTARGQFAYAFAFAEAGLSDHRS